MGDLSHRLPASPDTRGWNPVTERSAQERPLDAQEMRALQLIEQQVRDTDPEFPQRLGSRPGQWHPPIRQTGTRVRPRVVAAVMLATAVYATALTLLPDTLTVVAIVVIQLVLDRKSNV